MAEPINHDTGSAIATAGKSAIKGGAMGFILTGLACAAAATAADGFEPKVFTGIQGSLPYCILTPPEAKSGPVPLVLVLHGAGERGTNNQSQLTHGSALFLDAQNRAKFPAVLTSATLAQRTMTSGRRSIIPLYTLRAASYSLLTGVITLPRGFIVNFEIILTLSRSLEVFSGPWHYP